MQTKYRRLSPTELRKLNLSPTSRRYVKASISKPTKRTKTLSHRAYETKQIRRITGQKLTREQLTQRRQTGELPYRSFQSEQNVAIRERYKKIRQDLSDKGDGLGRDGKRIPLKDVKLVDKKNEYGWDLMTDEDHEDFQELFNEYERKGILIALGSPVTMKKRAA
jgi:hypothetical protein